MKIDRVIPTITEEEEVIIKAIIKAILKATLRGLEETQRAEARDLTDILVN